MLSKLHHFVNKDILLSVNYAIFHLDLAYVSFVWGQDKFSISRTTLLQKRAVRIIHSDHFQIIFHGCNVLNMSPRNMKSLTCK